MTSEICHQLIIHSVCPLNPLLTESAMAFAGREAAPPTLCLLAACSALSNPSSIGNSQTAVFSLDNSAGVHICCDMALSPSLSDAEEHLLNAERIQAGQVSFVAPGSDCPPRMAAGSSAQGQLEQQFGSSNRR